MKQKQLVLRLPAQIKPEALLVVMQCAAGHVVAATANAKRNALRNGFDPDVLTEADLRAAVQYLQLATTSALAEITSPATVVKSSSTVAMKFTDIEEGV